MKFSQLLVTCFAIGAIAAPTLENREDQVGLREPASETTEVEMRFTDENDIIVRTKVCKRRYELVNNECVRRCGRHQIRTDGVCVPGCHKSAKLVDDKCVCPEGERYTKRHGCTE